MNIKQKLLKKENNKKILKLFNINKTDRRKKTFYDSEGKNNYKKIKKNIFSYPKNYANKTIVVTHLKDINYLDLQKEFIPRIVINNSNLLKLKHSHSSVNFINNKLFKNNFDNNKNDSFYTKFLDSKYNFATIRYPMINKENKNRERNFFNKRNIHERKGAYESCNDLSYQMPCYYKKKIINKKQKNNSVFGSFQMKNKSNIYNRILDITKFVNKEINGINRMVKKPFQNY